MALISHIKEQVDRLIIREMSERNIAGLVPSHGGILMALYQSKTLTMRELANLIGKDKSTVTALVNKLISYGYVKKEKDPYDNRRTFVSLTEKGEEVKPYFEEISKKLISTIYGDMSEEEQQGLINLLNRVRGNIQI